MMSDADLSNNSKPFLFNTKEVAFAIDIFIKSVNISTGDHFSVVQSPLCNILC